MIPRPLVSRLLSRVLLASLAVVALFVPAFADELAPITGLPAHLEMDPPDAWLLLPGLSAKLGATAAVSAYFGDEPTTSGAVAYGRANRGAVYLTWVDSERTVPSPETTLRQSFDDLHQAPYQASSEAGSTQEVSYRERSAGGLVEMNFEWTHRNNATINIVRALGWKDQEARVHLAIAECVLPSEMVSQSRPLCESTLASLRLKAPGHAPLHALAEPAPAGPNRPDGFEVPALETNEELPAPGSQSRLNAPPPGAGEVLYDGRGKGSKKESNRTIIAIGVVLLGVAVWLTTRSRARNRDDDDESSSRDDDDSSDDDSDRKPEGQV